MVWCGGEWEGCAAGSVNSATGGLVKGYTRGGNERRAGWMILFSFVQDVGVVREDWYE